MDKILTILTLGMSRTDIRSSASLLVLAALILSALAYWRADAVGVTLHSELQNTSKNLHAAIVSNNQSAICYAMRGHASVQSQINVVRGWVDKHSVSKMSDLNIACQKYRNELIHSDEALDNSNL